MFPPRKPDLKRSMQELQQNLVMAAVLVATVRVAPYLLHFLQRATS
jgi:hypothetical protein